MILRATPFLLALAVTPAAIAAPCGAVMPVSGEFSSGFGMRGRRLHPGVDLLAPIGRPVLSAAPGTVAFAGRYYDYGLMVEIAHADGTRARYAHLSRLEAGLAPGAAVAAGQPIGAVGRTGRATAPHLHVELRREGRPVDPWPWLTRGRCDGLTEVAEAPPPR